MGVIPPIFFWPAAAVLAGFCMVAVLWFSARAAKRALAAGEDPAREVYRRQLQDLDDMVDRGVLAPEEREATRAETARRLLSQTPEAGEKGAARLAPVIAAGLAALAAIGLYVWLGAPGVADQPYQARLAQWKNTNPNALRPDEVAAVLRDLAKTHPNDPKLFGLLGRVERMAGDPVSAAQYLNRAIKLDPNNADLYASLGDALAAGAGDKPTPEAEAALNHALAIDPNNPSALYYLGGARAADGDKAGAVKLWRQLATQLPPGDVRGQQLQAMIAQLEQGPSAAQVAKAQASVSGADQAGFIRGMVASLQAKLDAQPDDPAGWARLVRSYHVLHDQAAEDRALARARSLFAKRPGDLATVEAAAR